MLQNLSESAKLYLKDSLPGELVSAVVKALVPLEPKELLIVIAYHYARGDGQIKSDAVKTLKSMPASLINTIVGEDVPDFVLSFIYHNYALSRDAVYSFITNKNLSDSMFIELAGTDNEAILEILVKNQVRILKNDKIFDTIISNSCLSKVSKDQLMEFFVRVAGKELRRINIEVETKDLLPSDKVSDLPSSPDKSLNLPSVLQKKGLPSDAQRVELPSDLAMLPDSISGLPSDAAADLPTSLISKGLPSELIEDQKEEDADEGKKLTLYQRIDKMTISQKIKLALLGNKEARTVLLRSSNKIVVESVMKSPRITDGEVVSIANSRNMSEDIIRMIASKREWQKNYKVRQALVTNPKTPVPIALKLLGTISKQDLKHLSISKNISSVIAATAKRMIGDVK